VAAAVKGRSTDPEAYRLYLQGRHFIDRFTREDTANGIVYLKKALALEPEFALAQAELGRAYASEADWGWAPAAEGYGRARETVARALALEPDLAEGHSGMGWIRMLHDWDWRGAAASYRRALELAPGNALVLHQASLLAGCMGHLEEAIGLARRSVEQDPLSASAHFFLGTTLFAADRLPEAEAALRKALDLSPQRAATRAWLSIALSEQGRSDQALAEALREPEEWARLHALAIIHHRAGRHAESDEVLRELTEKCATNAAYQVAEAHGAREEADAAFEWLERAYAQRDSGVAWTKIDPFLRPLHADPRWEMFLRKMRLAD
jgi:tetratricopeptide (TPR) repeat protein